MQNDVKFFLWFEMTKDNIVPYDTPRGHKVKKVLDSLPEEEARKLKRKYRKIMRTVCKPQKTLAKEQIPHWNSHYGFGVKKTLFKEYRAYYMQRRSYSVFFGYVEMVKAEHTPRPDDYYCKYRGKKKK